MEGEDKSKKVAKEKRSVKKTKGVAVPIEKMPVAAEANQVPPVSETRQTPARKSQSAGSAKRSIRSKQTMEPTYEQIQLRAYFIGERRKELGISGDATSDWVEAERELNEELAVDKSS